MKFLKQTIYILSGLLVLSCNSPADNHEHDHGEEGHFHNENLVNHTLISNYYQVYVSYPQLIKGEKSDFLIHLTELREFNPVEKGSVTISLIKGTKGIRHTADKMLHAGVFKPALQPKEAGKYTLIIEYKTSDKAQKFEVSDIEVFENHELGDAAYQHVETGNEISFLLEQAWKTNFGVQKINKKTFNEVIETSGQLLSANEDEVSIVAPFAGIVNMESSLIEGTKVNKGEQLLMITGKGLASENISVHYNQLKTNYQKAKANYERSSKLIKEKIVSEQAFLEAKTEYEQAKVAFENVSATGGGKVQASLNGFVKNVFVSEGQFVEAGTPLVEISQNQKLILRADVSHNHWNRLPNITEANFLTSYDEIVHNTKEHAGRLISYGRTAASSSWSTPLYFEIENIDNLIPGSYVEVYLISKDIPNVIAVPLSSVIEEQGNYFVFVQLNGETYEKREIETGMSNGKEIEVISGLSDGEVVVTKGAFQVKLASMSSALPAHDHAH